MARAITVHVRRMVTGIRVASLAVWAGVKKIGTIICGDGGGGAADGSVSGHGDGVVNGSVGGWR